MGGIVRKLLSESNHKNHVVRCCHRRSSVCFPAVINNNEGAVRAHAGACFLFL